MIKTQKHSKKNNKKIIYARLRIVKLDIQNKNLYI